jgi:uncharacterized protein YbbC (DUF1343 family)
VEVLLSDSLHLVRGQRVGLITNHTGVARDGVSTIDLLHDHPDVELVALFGPEHGIRGTADAGERVEDATDPDTGLPIYSLYTSTLRPPEGSLDDVDVLVFDMQDVGARYYTYVSTMAYAMESAGALELPFVVLDRPNPIGGVHVEGNCLDPAYSSFVGMYAIPMRHGLTIGEVALLFNDHFGIGCELSVITMEGWKRQMHYYDTGLPWIPPSPNLPTPASALVYPGQVLWEGTNVSEGRGTTQPFEVFGAPFFDTDRIEASMSTSQLPGVQMRPLAFEPTSDKWANSLCHGFQLHVTDQAAFRPYLTTLILLEAVIAEHSGSFEWNLPPYEYEYEKLPFDILTGDPGVREALGNQTPIEDLAETWTEELQAFEEVRRTLVLYE